MLIVVGPFPPPVHGASAITERAAHRLEAAGHAVRRCDILSSERIGFFRQIGKGVKYIKALNAIVRCGQPAILYMCLSGGLSLIYDMVLVLAARLRGSNCIFHHHSFAYLTKKSLVLKIVIQLAGHGQKHIVLCNTMGGVLCQQYGANLSYEVISNLAFLDPPEGRSRSKSKTLSTVGYLSNISLEKGIDRFFDVIRQVRARGVSVKGVVAGPCTSGKVQAYVEEQIKTLGGIQYIGPVFAERKAEFLEAIDLLIFPTRYRNEAAPLVIYEAQLAGLPVATTTRGCLVDMALAPDVLLNGVAGDLEPLVAKIEDWSSDERAYAEVQNQTAMRIAGFLARGGNDAARFDRLFSNTLPKSLEAGG